MKYKKFLSLFLTAAMLLSFGGCTREAASLSNLTEENASESILTNAEQDSLSAQAQTLTQQIVLFSLNYSDLTENSIPFPDDACIERFLVAIPLFEEQKNYPYLDTNRLDVEGNCYLKKENVDQIIHEVFGKDDWTPISINFHEETQEYCYQTGFGIGNHLECKNMNSKLQPHDSEILVSYELWTSSNDPSPEKLGEYTSRFATHRRDNGSYYLQYISTNKVSTKKTELLSQEEATAPPQMPWNYHLLTDWQKSLYDLMEENGISKGTSYFFEKPIPTNSKNGHEVEDVVSLYEYNHPTENWREIPKYYIFYGDNGAILGIQCVENSFDNHSIYNEMELAFREREEWYLQSLPPKDAPDIEKIQAIAKLLADQVEYCYPAIDYTFSEGCTKEEKEMLPYAHSEYGAIVNGWAVCDGYARAFQYLADKLDVTSIFIEGYLKNGAHAWNMVWLDDSWYHVDVTWMDKGENGIDWSWFLLSDEEILPSHIEIFWASTRGMDHDPLFERPFAPKPYPNREKLIG